MEVKDIVMNLVIKLLAGILVGILVGLYGPDWLAQLLFTGKSLIGQLIKFTIPLIILFYIASGIASLPKNSGALLGKTIMFSYGSTIIAGCLAFWFASSLLPQVTVAHSLLTDGDAAKIVPFFKMSIPPLFGVMTALALAFVFGIGISASNASGLRALLTEGKNIIELLLTKVIIPVLPLYIAGVFTGMAAEGTVFNTLETFAIVLLLALVLHWFWLTILYVVTGVTLRRSPIQLLRNMFPAYITALGTMSSAATIPVSLQATKANKVDDSIANFTVPLCANIHLSGSTITLVTCATAVMLLMPDIAMPSFIDMIGFILMLGVIMIAAPAAPGGAVMSAVGLLATMLGFTDAALALMIALYLAQDSFGTACNVTGDGIIALWVDHFAHEDSKAVKQVVS